MNIAELLRRAAALHPHRPAVSLGTRVLMDYGQYHRQVASLASGLLTQRGLAPGDSVAILSANRPEYPVALFALWHAGLTVVPINAKLHAEEAAWIVAHSGAKLVLADDQTAKDLADLPQRPAAPVLVLGSAPYDRLCESQPIAQSDCASQDLAWLFYTSGTTGRPKGAMLTHGNLLALTMSYLSDVDDVAADDAIVHLAALSHGAGGCALPHVVRGANQVLPESGGFDPEEFLALCRHWRGVSAFLAPTMVKRLVAAARREGQADAPGLKTIIYGGGPMYAADLADAMTVFGPRFAQIYGQGEAPMGITALPRRLHEGAAADRLGSVGLPRTNIEVRVEGPDGTFASPGTVGEVLCRGPVVMRGYWKDDAATAAALCDGWLRTGDVGQLSADGFLTLLDRSKDLVISGGSNIYPREVEEVLLAHPGVAEVAVVGRPHPEWGEELVAFVVAAPAGVDERELDDCCLAHLARFKRPRHYRMVDALPKNNYGKVLKTRLREMLNEETING